MKKLYAFQLQGYESVIYWQKWEHHC